MKLSLTRALAQVKLYTDRINTEIRNLQPTTPLKGGQLVEHPHLTEEDFISKFEAAMQSITDLRENKRIIQSAIIKANNETTLVINDCTYTIIEAIKRKEDILVDKDILHKLVNSHKKVKTYVENNNLALHQEIQSILNSKASSSAQQSKTFIDEVTANMNTLSNATMINEVAVEELIKSMDNDISTFIAEVDMALSEVNAKTEIEVTLIGE